MTGRSREHLDEVGESYARHMGFALRAAGVMFAGAVLTAIHAFIPGIFRASGSLRICKLADEMRVRREH